MHGLLPRVAGPIPTPQVTDAVMSADQVDPGGRSPRRRPGVPPVFCRSSSWSERLTASSVRRARPSADALPQGRKRSGLEWTHRPLDRAARSAPLDGWWSLACWGRSYLCCCSQQQACCVRATRPSANPSATLALAPTPGSDHQLPRLWPADHRVYHRLLARACFLDHRGAGRAWRAAR